MHPDLPFEFPPLKSLDEHPHNLPMQPTPLIGREKELTAVKNLLAEETARVVTLTGPGGMGKTRLALQVAADMIEHYKHGAFFVDLAVVQDPGLMLPMIGKTLKIRETGGQPLSEILKDFLADRHMLLVLDNFEQIMGAELQLVPLMSQCPGVGFLVTSRESLHIRGEKVFAVPPMSLPDEPQHMSSDLQRHTQYESVRLFIERAVAVKQTFRVTNDNAPSVAEICVHLDGIPLAIELAAARIKLLTPQAILKRLQNRFKLLSSGAHDLPLRQQTLRSTIDWSYDLLDDAQKNLFGSLSVFDGGFSLDAAEQLLGDDILDGLESLLDKSLLLQEEVASGEERFHMLESIREYGRSRLRENDSYDELREKHAVYFGTLVKNTEPDVGGGRQKECLQRLDREQDNIRESLVWLAEINAAAFASMASSLGRYWQIRGFLTEGRVWLRQALALVPEESKDLLAKVLLAAGDLARQQGDYTESLELLSRALGIYTDAGDADGIAHSLICVGWTHCRMDNLETAFEYFNRAKKVGDKLGDEMITAKAMLGLGGLYLRTGDTHCARNNLEECFRIFSESGDKILESQVVGNLAIAYHHLGNLEKTIEYLDMARNIHEDLGDKDNLKLDYNNLGDIYQKLGKHVEAEESYKRLFDLSEYLRDSRIFCTACCGLADVYLASGDADKALKYAKRGLQEVGGLGAGVEHGVGLRVCADAMLACGRPKEACEYHEKCIPLLDGAEEDEELKKAKKGYEKALAVR